MTQEELNAQLLETVRDSDTVKAEELLNAGAEVNSVNYRGSTPLMRACTYGRMDMVRFLLRKGADPNAINIWGNTALLIAAMYGRIEIVRVLLEAGADPNLQDRSGHTPIIYTGRFGQIEIAELLIDYGADPNACDEEGRTVMNILKKNYPDEYDLWICNAVGKARRETLKREDSAQSRGHEPDFDI